MGKRLLQLLLTGSIGGANHEISQLTDTVYRKRKELRQESNSNKCTLAATPFATDVNASSTPVFTQSSTGRFTIRSCAPPSQWPMFYALLAKDLAGSCLSWKVLEASDHVYFVDNPRAQTMIGVFGVYTIYCRVYHCIHSCCRVQQRAH